MATTPRLGIQLVVGLGNPGPNYAETRHNAGAWLVETLCRKYRISLNLESKFSARVGQHTINGQEIKFLISNTFMNHSGRAVGSIANYYHIPAETILIVHDELDLPPGTIRFKTDGGHGGHNGLRDIIHHLNSPEFHRLRIGIGHPGHKDLVVDYVLQRPSLQEEKSIKAAIEKGIQILPQIISGNWEQAMNQLHRETEN